MKQPKAAVTANHSIRWMNETASTIGKVEKNKPISLASKVEGNCNCHEKEKKKPIIDSNGFKIESTKPRVRY